MMDKVQELREQAKQHTEDAYQSFERCDTDGFLSQWASAVNAQRCNLEADLLEAGGVWKFWGLFDLEGRRVRAKLINGQYGPCWAFCDAHDRFTGKFISAHPARPETLQRKGYVEADELAPAKVVVSGKDICALGVRCERTDGGYPPDAINE